MTKEELIRRLKDIEWEDFEVKEARSELPKNIWETVSAFSNTSGGWIILGIRQKGKGFEVTGVENAANDVVKNVVSNVVEKLNDRQNKIIELLRQEPTLSASQLAQQVSSTLRTVQRDLARLRYLGIISRTGSDKGGYWKFTDRSDVVENIADDVVKNVVSNVVEKLNDRQNKIIELLRQEPTLSASQLALRLSSTLRTVQRDLARLRQLGIISCTGSDKK